LLPFAKGLSIYFYAIFIFLESPFSLIKAPIGEHYGHVYASSMANIRVCVMNGSMIEHDGLGIAFFSIDILEDMVAC
jgi:hypothetical protein